VLGGVFISYRREDSGGFAGRIYDRLVSRLGRDSVFFDVDAIPPGRDFVDVLSERVGRCDALVAIIGKQWVSSVDAADRRRLDDPHDFVRVEIEAALQRDVPVIPVLVDGAAPPQAADLPDGMKKLARRQAIEISLTRFDSDAELLTNALAEIEGRQEDAHAEAAPTAEQSKAPPAPAHVAAAASSQAASSGATLGSAPLKPASRRSLPYFALGALVIVAAIAWLAGGQRFDTVLEKLTGEHVSIPDQRRGSDISKSVAPMPEVDQSPRGAAPRTEDKSIAAPPASQSGEDADAAARIDLGDRYYYGIGVERDYDKAFNLYRQAAEQGSHQGEYYLGWMYDHGRGTQQDYFQAFAWYKKAAESGYAPAQNDIGVLYETGQAVERDYAKALAWFQKAANQDNPTAERNIGVLYETGKGVTQDIAEARAWYQKAAAQGDEGARAALLRLQSK
jgi:TPR repeat protein